MEILSYPIGLLVGLFPIAVSLGPSGEPAHLLLDSRPVCELTTRSPGCMVDLGPDPRVHLLELLRTDASGQVSERVRRWVNRPGIEPEVLAAGGCDEPARACNFDLTWAHPARLDPKRIDIFLDGTPAWHGRERRAHVSLPAGARPQILVADAEFPDGTRATYSRTFYAFYPEQVQAALQAVPLLPSEGSGTDARLADALRERGWPVRTVEETEPAITFVMEPTAFDAVAGFLSATPSLPGTHERKIGAATASEQRLDVIVPNQPLSTYRVPAMQLGRRVPIAVPKATWSRYADAVAAAGYELGASPRRRAVVLVLGRFDRQNVSTFEARQARAYLSEVLVPLIVWRIGDPETARDVGPEWPAGPVIANLEDLRREFAAVFAGVDRQRIAWLEGARDVRHSGRTPAPGIELAGRNGPGETTSTAPASSTGDERSGRTTDMPSALGPPGGNVYALASARDGALLVAGTHAGAFRSQDGGASWERAGRGLPGKPVRSLAIPADASTLVFAATDTDLFRSDDAGRRWERLAGAGVPAGPTCVAVDPGGRRLVYVGTRGAGVLRSEDDGRTFLRTTLVSGEVRALAVDPGTHVVLAATEEGLFRTEDRGLHWTPIPGVSGAILALATDPQGHGRAYAATAGDGLFASTDGGVTWRATRLARAYLTDVAVGASGVLLASSPDGVFSSADRGGSWALARVGTVAVLAGAGPTDWIAGGNRGILRGDSRGRKWAESNAGLLASAVFSLTALDGPRPDLVAGTARGMLRSADGEAWKRLPGSPEAAEFYSVAQGSGTGPDLIVGSSGEIGRSFGLDGSWSWLPAPGVFGLSLDPAHPNLVFAATRGAPLRSEDGGLTWQAFPEGLVRTFPLQLAVSAVDPSIVYAATAGSGVYRSANSGRSWKPGGAELSRAIVRCLATHPTSSDVVYAGTDRGVFASVTGTRTWSPQSRGLPVSPVYSLLGDPGSPETLFAGTGEGLFVTRDGGGSWTRVPGGVVDVAVTALVLDRPRQVLYAATLGAGVYAVALRDSPAPDP